MVQGRRIFGSVEVLSLRRRTMASSLRFVETMMANARRAMTTVGMAVLRMMSIQTALFSGGSTRQVNSTSVSSAKRTG